MPLVQFQIGLIKILNEFERSNDYFNERGCSSNILLGRRDCEAEFDVRVTMATGWRLLRFRPIAVMTELRTGKKQGSNHKQFIESLAYILELMLK